MPHGRKENQLHKIQIVRNVTYKCRILMDEKFTRFFLNNGQKHSMHFYRFIMWLQTLVMVGWVTGVLGLSPVLQSVICDQVSSSVSWIQFQKCIVCSGTWDVICFSKTGVELCYQHWVLVIIPTRMFAICAWIFFSFKTWSHITCVCLQLSILTLNQVLGTLIIRNYIFQLKSTA